MTLEYRDKVLLAGIGVVLLWLLYTKRDSVSSAVIQAEGAVMDVVKRVSDYGRELIQRFEGGSLTAYPDAGGYSIGYGHYMGKTPTMQQISADQAASLLENDLANVDAMIAKWVRVPLTQNQHDALASAAYNLGGALFWSSARKAPTHFLDALNAGDYQGAADLLLTFNKSQGQVNSTLVARRQQERELFLS